MRCPQCRTDNPDDFVFCLQCGSQIAARASGEAAEEADLRDPPPDRHVEAGFASASRSSPMLDSGAPARLLVQQGSVDQRAFNLDKPVTVIGRRLGNDVVIHDTNVSRQHARLTRDDDGFSIEDTNSANGTVLNNERVEGIRPLRDGDVIHIGDAQFVFEVNRLAGPAEGTVAFPVEWDAASTAPEAPVRDEPPAGVRYEPLAGPGAPVEVRIAPRAAAEEPRMTSAELEPARVPATEWTDEASEPEVLPMPSLPREEAPELASSAAGGQPEWSALDRIGPDLADVRRDLADLAAHLRGTAERVGQLEQDLGSATDDARRLADVARGPAAQPLRDLGGWLADADATLGPDRIRPTIDVLEQLAAQPRDIELLRELSRESETLRDLVRLHLRLMDAGPEIRDALERLLS